MLKEGKKVPARTLGAKLEFRIRIWSRQQTKTPLRQSLTAKLRVWVKLRRQEGQRV